MLKTHWTVQLNSTPFDLCTFKEMSHIRRLKNKREMIAIAVSAKMYISKLFDCTFFVVVFRGPVLGMDLTSAMHCG